MTSLIPSRGLGEVVVINGIERPDLIDQFDLLKTKTVMIRGTVFAKDRDGNLVIPADVETETQAILAEAIEQEGERERLMLAKSQTYKCPRCKWCGQMYCIPRSHSVGHVCYNCMEARGGVCEEGGPANSGCGSCRPCRAAAKACEPQCQPKTHC